MMAGSDNKEKQVAQARVTLGWGLPALISGPDLSPAPAWGCGYGEECLGDITFHLGY